MTDLDIRTSDPELAHEDLPVQAGHLDATYEPATR